MGPVKLEQVQTTQARHHEVLQDDGGLDPNGQFQRLCAVGAIMKIDVLQIGQRATYRLGHDGLIIDEQYHGRALWG